jgi:Collagen triple helix repeat (20 copies)
MLHALARHLHHNVVGYLALFVAIGGTSYAAVSLPSGSVGTRQLRDGAVIAAKVRPHSLVASDFARGQLPAGPRGATGATGSPGPQGSAGATGSAGLPGAPGGPGKDGIPGQPGADGTNGKTVLNGSGAPDDGLGADGDFYLDTSADAIYGPKSSGTWGNATSLIGASGPSGTANVVTKIGIVIVPANGQSTVFADCPASSTVTGGGFAAAGSGLTVTESTPTDHNGTQSWVVEATNTSTTTAIELVAQAQCAS